MATLGECKLGTFELGAGEQCTGVAIIVIVPDVGHPNRETMTSPWNNDLASRWWLSDLEPVAEAPSRVKGPNTLIFEYNGSYYKLPRTAIDRLGSGLHFWRIDTGPDQDLGEIQEFWFVRSPGALGALAAAQSRILS
jgi:hypothetical protein